MSWYLSVLKKYAVFSGRSQRKEYWMFGLFHGIIIILSLLVADLGDAAAALVGIYYLATLLPTLAVTFRRLHDMDRSGWWLCIQLVPILGAIVLLVFLATDGTKGDNRFGPDPKARATQ